MLAAPFGLDEDDLRLPLYDVTFAVIDLETTGLSADSCAITEFAAAKFHGGERIGVLQTLVNPTVPVPATITNLTGITDTMVEAAPEVPAVLPIVLEFIGNAVVVGHNVTFDTSFVAAALRRLFYEPIPNAVVDTCQLARRLLGEDVPDCKLATLARHFDTSARPNHRALDDTLATAELLHRLLELAAGFDVLTLGDLLELPPTVPRAKRRRRPREFDVP